MAVGGGQIPEERGDLGGGGWENDNIYHIYYIGIRRFFDDDKCCNRTRHHLLYPHWTSLTIFNENNN